MNWVFYFLKWQSLFITSELIFSHFATLYKPNTTLSLMYMVLWIVLTRIFDEFTKYKIETLVFILKNTFIVYSCHKSKHAYWIGRQIINIHYDFLIFYFIWSHKNHIFIDKTLNEPCTCTHLNTRRDVTTRRRSYRCRIMTLFRGTMEMIEYQNKIYSVFFVGFLQSLDKNSLIRVYNYLIVNF